MTSISSQIVERHDTVRASLSDFEAKLHIEVEGPEHIVSQARPWFSELLTIAYSLQKNRRLVPDYSNKVTSVTVSEPKIPSKSKKTGKRNRAPVGRDQNSEVTEQVLSVETLQQVVALVKAYHKGASGEECLLWMAYALKTVAHIEIFSTSRMISIYSALLSSGLVVAKIKDMGHTIQNMMSPSRNKQWIESLGHGYYQLSTNGILAINRLLKEHGAVK